MFQVYGKRRIIKRKVKGHSRFESVELRKLGEKKGES